MSFCRSCGAEVEWVLTVGNGRAMPLDVVPTADGNIVKISRTDGSRMTRPDRFGNEAPVVRYVKKGEQLDKLAIRRTSHFATCPKAAEHRR